MSDFNEKIALENFQELSSKLRSYIYDKNKDFNDEIDQVFLDSNQPIEILGDHFLPSEILFYLNKELYDEELKNSKNHQLDLRKEEFDKLLNLKSNKARTKDLIELIRNKRVIPFVGAGLTAACGMLTWTNFLLRLVNDHNIDLNSVKELLSNGKYEHCADLLLEEIKELQFNQDYSHTFRFEGDAKGSVLYLPALFHNGVVTTNFDSILESAYLKSAGGRPIPILSGANTDWIDHVKKGKNQIYKLHGTLEGTAHRVLTKKEYDDRYGETEIDFSLSHPKFIKSCTETSSFFFLGCSLTVDRIVNVLEAITTQFSPRTIHYALLPMPADDAEVVRRQNTLARASILPIWYTAGEYQNVELLLDYIKLSLEGTI